MWKQPCLLWLILSHLPCPVLNNESTLKLHPHSKGSWILSSCVKKASARENQSGSGIEGGGVGNILGREHVSLTIGLLRA